MFMFNAYTMHLLENEDAVGTLLFIDKQRGVVEALIADGLLGKAEFALASDWRTSNELYAAVAAADLKTRVVSCEAVDLEIDGRLKRSLQETVTKFARSAHGGWPPACARDRCSWTRCHSAEPAVFSNTSISDAPQTDTGTIPGACGCCCFAVFEACSDLSTFGGGGCL